MAQLLRNYVNKLEKLDDEVDKNADKILTTLDLDELLKDPEGYLLALGDAFLAEHIDEVEKASKEGARFAEKVLKTL